MRQRLNGGSYSTITKYLRAWKQVQKAPEAPKKDEIP
ncbi:DNA-binding protein [Paenibacillus enshidis]|uniref:DNA-binding protein n=1 Tax=Paenibacillus enshidis TaxID=1458439 RepID=A0ABV5AVD1_9BACL